MVAHRPGDNTAHSVFEECRPHERDSRLVLANRDELAFACASPVFEGGHDGDGGMEWIGREICVLVTPWQRDLPRKSANRFQARDADEHVAEPAPTSTVTGALHGRHVHDDDAGIEKFRLFIVNPPPAELAAREVAEDDVRHADETVQ